MKKGITESQDGQNFCEEQENFVSFLQIFFVSPNIWSG